MLELGGEEAAIAAPSVQEQECGVTRTSRVVSEPSHIDLPNPTNDMSCPDSIAFDGHVSQRRLPG
jgi:hypothetical protein